MIEPRSTIRPRLCARADLPLSRQPSGRSVKIECTGMTVIQIVAVSAGAYVLLLALLLAWLHHASKQPPEHAATLVLTRIADDGDLRDAA